MKITDPQINSMNLLGTPNKKNGQKAESAMEFERLFARQLVQEMTKGLFENDDKQSMTGGSAGMYREHIVDTLAGELAEQRQLGMADMVSEYLNRKIE